MLSCNIRDAYGMTVHWWGVWIFYYLHFLRCSAVYIPSGWMLSSHSLSYHSGYGTVQTYQWGYVLRLGVLPFCDFSISNPKLLTNLKCFFLVSFYFYLATFFVYRTMRRSRILLPMLSSQEYICDNKYIPTIYVTCAEFIDHCYVEWINPDDQSYHRKILRMKDM